MKAKAAKFVPLGKEAQQAEAAKIARLRALRLAKEAAEKEGSVVNAGKSTKRSSRS